MDAKQILDEREALIEMYKAGFLDGYRTHSKAKSKADYVELNKFYKLAFYKRFEKPITKELKKMGK